MNGPSVTHGKAAADVSRLLDLVEHRNRVVFVGNVALSVGGGQQRIVGHAEFSGALARTEKCRRTQEGPIEIVDVTQGVQERLAGGGFGLVRGWEVRRIQKHLPGSDLQAGGATDDHVALHARPADQVNQLLRIAALEPQCADDHVMSLQQGQERIRLCHIAHSGRHARARRKPGGVARNSADSMVTIQRLVEQAPADVAGGADDGDFHGLRSSSLAGTYSTPAECASPIGSMNGMNWRVRQILTAGVAAALGLGAAASASTPDAAWSDTPGTRVEALALLETLNADLLSNDSATLTLDRW